MNRFFFVRRIRFLFNSNIRMGCHKILLIKRDMTDDAETVGNNTKLKNIAKMSIDIQLLDLKIGRSMGGHRAIGSLIRIIWLIKTMSFRIRLKLLDVLIYVLRIIFGNKCFDSRIIKDDHIRFYGINSLADWFCNMRCKLFKKSCLKWVIFEASGTLVKPQNSRNGFEQAWKARRSCSVGIEKIRWTIKAHRKACKRYIQVLPVDA